MGIWEFVKSELIDVIEWLDDTGDTLVWRFPDQDHQIKMGAKLTVREGQAAVFVNEGQIADVFSPGLYSLSTQNMPVLTTLRSWKYGFESPFKAEVYFVNTRNFLDLRWGTQNPIMIRDPDFGMVRLRAFGTYGIRVTDPGKFMKEVVPKITAARKYIDKERLDVELEVDGGINMETAPKACSAGADILVAGSAIFGGEIERRVKELRKAAEG